MIGSQSLGVAGLSQGTWARDGYGARSNTGSSWWVTMANFSSIMDSSCRTRMALQAAWCNSVMRAAACSRSSLFSRCSNVAGSRAIRVFFAGGAGADVVLACGFLFPSLVRGMPPSFA